MTIAQASQPTPYQIRPRFLVSQEIRGTYRKGTPSLSYSVIYSYDLQFVNDIPSSEPWLKKHKKVIIVGGVALLVGLGAANSENQNASPTDSAASTPSPDSAGQSTPSASSVKTVATNSSVPTVSLDGMTFNLYSLASLQSANLQFPTSSPILIQITGTITKFLSGAWILITDGNGNYAVVSGNDGSNVHNLTPLDSNLEIGDSITASGFYGGQADNSNYQSISSLVPPSTPVILPLDESDDLTVVSTSQSSTQSWEQVFSYTGSPTDTKVDSGDSAVPSFTVSSEHWRILWQVTGSDPVEQGVKWSINGWLSSPENSSSDTTGSVFDQQLLNGTSVSGIYNGVGPGTYYLSYDLGFDNILIFTVEEMK